MKQDSRLFALLLSLFLSVGMIVLLIFFEVPKNIIFGAVLLQFFISFSISYVLSELFWFKTLRSLSSTIEKVIYNKGENYNMNNGSTYEFINEYIKQNEEELSKLRELENYRKDFISNVAHELKTPLFSAQGYIETLQKGAMRDEKVRDQFLCKSLESLNYLGRLIDNLTLLSQLELNQTTLRFEVFNIVLLTKKVFDQLRPYAEQKNIKLKFSKKYPAIFVHADKIKIRQVLINLISNGIKYSYKRTHVVITFEKNMEAVAISISNRGSGIPEDEVSKIFDRFYRVEKSRSKKTGGTGLGLAIVKNIVEMHNSQIKVTHSNKTTNFIFSLAVMERKNQIKVRNLNSGTS